MFQLTFAGGLGQFESAGGATKTWFKDNQSGDYQFSQGADMAFTIPSTSGSGRYLLSNNFIYGATVGDNYANISFNGNDSIYEGVAKFNFDGAGGGKLLAIAKDDDGNYLPISAAVTEIDAAAVPEPSAMLLGLLAVGSCACARRRARPVRG
ncbi:PEP-CTERM sorting domain-containing protein [bacterium]|nr:PEP-CTERM sorting domain-containing protein [bacterium]